MELKLPFGQKLGRVQCLCSDNRSDVQAITNETVQWLKRAAVRGHENAAKQDAKALAIYALCLYVSGIGVFIWQTITWLQTGSWPHCRSLTGC